jgi:hypothetical protein
MPLEVYLRLTIQVEKPVLNSRFSFKFSEPLHYQSPAAFDRIQACESAKLLAQRQVQLISLPVNTLGPLVGESTRNTGAGKGN